MCELLIFVHQLSTYSIVMGLYYVERERDGMEIGEHTAKAVALLIS